MILTLKKDLPVICMAAAGSNMWCAMGNCVAVINSKSLKVEVGSVHMMSCICACVSLNVHVHVHACHTGYCHCQWQQES